MPRKPGDAGYETMTRLMRVNELDENDLVMTSAVTSISEASEPARNDRSRTAEMLVSAPI